MQDADIFEGHSIEDIILDASAHYECEASDLEYEILEETEKRNLLLKKEKWVKARVTKKGFSRPKRDVDLPQFFQTILQWTQVADSAEVLDDEEQIHIDLINFKIDGLQEGKEVLDSLQHLASRYLLRNGHARKIVVDAQGLRQRRLEELDDLVQDIHDYVTKGKTTTTHPLTPGERRHVHLALDALGGVRTVSLGRGPKKRIRIFPKNRRGGQDRSGDYEASGY